MQKKQQKSGPRPVNFFSNPLSKTPPFKWKIYLPQIEQPAVTSTLHTTQRTWTMVSNFTSADRTIPLKGPHPNVKLSHDALSFWLLVPFWPNMNLTSNLVCFSCNYRKPTWFACIPYFWCMIQNYTGFCKLLKLTSHQFCLSFWLLVPFWPNMNLTSNLVCFSCNYRKPTWFTFVQYFWCMIQNYTGFCRLFCGISGKCTPPIACHLLRQNCSHKPEKHFKSFFGECRRIQNIS